MTVTGPSWSSCFVFPSGFSLWTHTPFSTLAFKYRQAFDDRQWVPCAHNSSYSFIPINFKLYRLFCHGLLICIWHFGGLNTIKVHYSGYFVCATPPTVLYRSIWNLAGSFVMVCRYACGFCTIVNLIFVIFFMPYRSFVCHYWQWPILIKCMRCYYLCVLRWLMRPVLALNCLLQIGQERSEKESSVGDALALAFCSASLIPFCFIFTSTPSYQASPLCSILCNMFLQFCWYVEVFKGGFEGVLVLLLLTTMGAFSYLKFSIEDFLWQTFIRHSGNMACPS